MAVDLDFLARLNSLGNKKDEEPAWSQTGEDLVNSPFYNQLQEWHADQQQNAQNDAIQGSLANAQRQPPQPGTFDPFATGTPTDRVPNPFAPQAAVKTELPPVSSLMPESQHAQEAFGQSWGLLTQEEGRKEVEETHRNLPAQLDQAEANVETAKADLDAAMSGHDPRAAFAKNLIYQEAQRKLDSLNRLQEVTQAQIEGLAPLPEKSAARNAAEHLARSASAFMVTQPVQAAGIFGGAAANAAGYNITSDENALYRWGDYAQQQVEKWFPGDQARQNETLTKAAEMLGVVGPAFLTAGASALPELSGAIRLGLKAAELHALGSSGAVPQYQAAKEAQENYEVEKSLADEGEVIGPSPVAQGAPLKAAALGYGTALAGSLPIRGIQNAAVATNLTQFARGALQSSATGATYVAGYDLINDLIAQGLYDPARPVGANIGEDAAIAAVLGGIGYSATQANAFLQGIKRRALATHYYQMVHGVPMGDLKTVPFPGLPAPETPPAPMEGGTAPTPPATPPGASEAPAQPQTPSGAIPMPPPPEQAAGASVRGGAKLSAAKPIESLSLDEIEKLVEQAGKGEGGGQRLDDLVKTILAGGELPEVSEEAVKGGGIAPHTEAAGEHLNDLAQNGKTPEQHFAETPPESPIVEQVVRGLHGHEPEQTPEQIKDKLNEFEHGYTQAEEAAQQPGRAVGGTSEAAAHELPGPARTPNEGSGEQPAGHVTGEGRRPEHVAGGEQPGQPGGEHAALSDDERRAFDAVLASGAKRAEWGDRLGTNGAGLERYIADGLDTNRPGGAVLRRNRNGVMRQTGVAKKNAAEAPASETIQPPSETIKQGSETKGGGEGAEEGGGRPGELEAAAQKETPPPQWALDHTKDTAGSVVWHEGDIALIRGFAERTGRATYTGAKEGVGRTNYDITAYTGHAFTPEELEKLKAARERAVAADEAAHQENPDGPFAGKGNFAASPSVPKELAGYAKEMLRLLGIKARLYLTTFDDAKDADFHGPFAAIGSARLDQTSTGVTRKLPNGDHYIALRLQPRTSHNIEALAHEMGHIFEKEEWKGADETTKNAIIADYEKWRQGTGDRNIKQHVESLRAHTSAKLTTMSKPEFPAKTLGNYWTSFNEWFADNVARWAVSSEKPLSLVERFFSRLGAALRKFYSSLSGKKWLPAKSIKDWLDSRGPSDPLQGSEPGDEQQSSGRAGMIAPAASFEAQASRSHADDIETGASMRHDLDRLGYYSKALEAAKGLKQAKGTPEQMLAQIKKAGTKQFEIQATGLDKFLEGKKSVTRDEITRHLEENRIALNETVRRPKESALVAASWSARSLDPGNPTYRETVLHLPDVATPAHEAYHAYETELRQKYNVPPHALDHEIPGTPQEIATLNDLAHKNWQAGKDQFISGHFPEPNITGHLMTSLVRDQAGRIAFNVDQIQSDWGQKLRSHGARDDEKIKKLHEELGNAQQREMQAELEGSGFAGKNHRFVYAANELRSKRAPYEQVPFGAKGELEALANYGPQEIRPEAKRLLDEWNSASSEAQRIDAERRTAESSTVGHPLVNTTDQWVNTTLRRAIRQAVEAGADVISIPSGDTVLSYNPGDRHGMGEFYNKIVPKNLRKLLRELDPETPDPEHVDKLATPTQGEKGEGFTVFQLTDKAKQKLQQEGQPMFAAAPGKRRWIESEHSAADINKLLKQGNTVMPALDLVRQVQNILQDMRHEIPDDLQAGALIGMDPINKKTVRLRFSTPDGQSGFNVFIDAKRAVSYRALFDKSPDPVLGILHIYRPGYGVPPEHVNEALRGRIRHEIVHFLWRTGRFTADERRRLVAHANELSPLDWSARHWLTVLRDPLAANVPEDITHREWYNDYYKDLSADELQEKIDEEQVAHTAELLSVLLSRDEGDPLRQDLMPSFGKVSDIYSTLLSGDIARRNPQDVAEHNYYTGEAAAGFKNRVVPERPPAPALSGGSNKEIDALTKIIADLKDALGLGGEGGAAVQGRRKLSIEGVDSGRKRDLGVKPEVAGQYDTETGAARYKLSTDIETIAHEGGHHLERVFGQEMENWKNAHASDLKPMAYAGATDELSEGFAEFFRAYITDHDNLHAAHPRLVEEFEDFLDEHDAKMLTDFERLHLAQVSQAYTDYRNASTVDRGVADMASHIDRKTRFPTLQLLKDIAQDRTISGWAAKLFEAGFDRTHPIYMLGRELLKIEDMNRKPGEKLRSLAAHENPNKLWRSMPDMYKAALSHIQYGMPYYHHVDLNGKPDDSRSASLYDAIQLASGKKWDPVARKKFSVYLEARRGEKEWSNWDDKNRRLLDLNTRARDLLNHITKARKGLSATNSKLELRHAALQRESALLMDAQRREARFLRKEDDVVNYQQFAGSPRAEERANQAARERREAALRHLAGRRSEAQRLYARLDEVSAPNHVLRVIKDELSRRMAAMDTQRDDIEAELGHLQDAARGHLQAEERQRSSGRMSEIRKEIKRAQTDISERTARRDRLRTDIDALNNHVDSFNTAIEVLQQHKDAARKEYQNTRERGWQRAPHRVKKDEFEERIRQLEAAYPTFRKAAQMVYDWQWRAAIHDFQAGRLTKDELDYYATRKDYYVPWQRDITDVDSANPNRKFTGPAGRRFQKDWAAYGSDRNVYDPLETIVDRAFHRALATHTNDFVKSIANLVRAAGPGGAAIAEIRTRKSLLTLDPGGVERLKKLIMGQGYDKFDADRIVQRITDDWGDSQLFLSTTPEKNVGQTVVLPLWENGERNGIEIRDPEWARAMYRAISAMPQDMRDIWWRIAALPSWLIQGTVWTSAAFQSVHALRTSAAAWIVSGNPAHPENWPIINTIRGARHHVFETPFAQLYREAGGPTGGPAKSVIGNRKDAMDVAHLRAAGIRYNPWTIVPAIIAGGVIGAGIAHALGVPGAMFAAPTVAGANVGLVMHRGFRHSLETLRHISDFFEDSTRLGVTTGYVKAALKNNPSLTPFQAMQEAVYQARTVFDGNRIGSQMLTVRSFFPFFMAHMNHLLASLERFFVKHDRGLGVDPVKLGLVSSAAGVGVGAVAGPVAGLGAAAGSSLLLLSASMRSELLRKALRPAWKEWTGGEMSGDEKRARGDSMKMFMAVIAGTLLWKLFQWLMNNGDEDTKREYDMVSARLRENWIPLKVGNTWVRIPKVFQYSVLDTWLEAAIDAETHGDPRMIERMLSGLYENTVPPLSFPIATIPLGIAANHNFYTGRAIVSDQLMHRDPQDQYDAYTSQLALGISRLTGFSPKMIDYAMSQGTGYWGRDAQALSNLGREGGPQSGSITQFPIIGTAVNRFMMDPYRMSEAEELYWHNMSSATSPYPRAEATFKARGDESNGGSAAAANAYLATIPQELRSYVLFQTQNSRQVRDMHPLKRATDINSVAYNLQREINGNGVKMEATGERQVLGPTDAQEVKSLLQQISAIELHNAWVEIGHPAMTGKQEMSVQATLDALQRKSPAIAAEYEARIGKKGVQEWSYVKDSWREEATHLNEEWQAATDNGEEMPDIGTARRGGRRR